MRFIKGFSQRNLKFSNPRNSGMHHWHVLTFFPFTLEKSEIYGFFRGKRSRKWGFLAGTLNRFLTLNPFNKPVKNRFLN